MKRQIVSVLLIFFLLFFSISCQHEENLSPTMGKAIFSLSKKTRGNGRVSETATPAFVLLAIKGNNGSVQENVKLPLFPFGQSYLTESLPAVPGIYQLTQFAVLDAANKIIYATPLEGSDLAKYVTDPLPMNFTISENQSTQVIPQVLAVSSEDTPESFGLASFSFEIVEAKFDFETTITIADNNPHGLIDYTLEVIAKNSALGTVKWTHQFAMAGAGTIHVPARYGHYTFKATKVGYLPHVQHFLATELAVSGTLSFEFLPKALTDFVVFDKGNGALKIYLPNDQNRCKLYARADVAEGVRIEYTYADRSAQTSYGLSVADLIVSECYPEPVLALTCGKNVNLFNNTPFALAQDYCAGVDLTRSNHTHSIEDVDIESFIFFSYFKLGNTTSVADYDDVIRIWKGANNH